jgi:carboxyl-terminal processing protease
VLASGLGGNQRADLVGGRTFGGACEQKLIPLEDGSALILSVAYYYTPAGKSILDEGVQPTVAVRLPIEFNDDETAAAPPPRRPTPSDDPVLRKSGAAEPRQGRVAAGATLAHSSPGGAALVMLIFLFACCVR